METQRYFLEFSLLLPSKSSEHSDVIIFRGTTNIGTLPIYWKTLNNTFDVLYNV